MNTHAQANPSGVHEVANWVTFLNERWPDVPFFHFLHHWENIVFSLTASLVLIGVAALAVRHQSLIPHPIQNVAEFFVETFDNLVTGIIGTKGRTYVPFIGTLFIFI